MLLAGDVGGTNTRLGLFATASPRPAAVEVRTYATGDFPTLESMLAAFLVDAGTSPSAIEGAAFGVAGPVVHDRASLTNAAWQVDARDEGAKFEVLEDTEFFLIRMPTFN